MSLRYRGQDLARRIGAASGLEEVLRLRRRTDLVAGSIAEHHLLQERLAEQVTALERALVPSLRRRAQAVADPTTRPGSGSGSGR